MDITKEKLLETKNKLEAQRSKLVADINAVEGALQLINSFLADTEKEVKKEVSKGKKK